MRDAVFTVSPNRQKRGRSLPTAGMIKGGQWERELFSHNGLETKFVHLFLLTNASHDGASVNANADLQRLVVNGRHDC